MDEKILNFSNCRRHSPLLSAAGIWLLLVLLWGGVCAAEDYVESFDTGLQTNKTTWRADFDPNHCKLINQQRISRSHSGRGCEYIELNTSPQGSYLRLRHRVPATEVVDETHLSLWIRSETPGIQLSAQLVLPNQENTRTGQMGVTTELLGDTYTKQDDWQQLTLPNLKQLILRKLVWARAYYETPDINQQGMYIDRVFLKAASIAGPVSYCIDDLRIGPLIKPTDILQVDHRSQGHATASPAKIRHDQLLVEGEPFFPLILPYHNEDIDDLARLRANVIWLPDFRNRELLTAVRKRGLWAIAEPPLARAPDGSTLGARTAGLAPFGRETTGILAWYLGTGIPPADKQSLVDWTQQLSGADRDFRRPFIADVAGFERSYSRLVDMLGTSRSVLHTGLHFHQYRDALLAKRDRARPGSFLWTWVETEPPADVNAEREAAGLHPLVVEPEQIRQQVFAALQAGCRGIGYMKTTSLDIDGPGAVERKLAIKQLNLELGLIDRWLATSTVQSMVNFSVMQRKQQIRQSNLIGHAERNKALLRERNYQFQQRARIAREQRAVVLEAGDGSYLILPAWLEEGAQFVPGHLAGHTAKMIVRGAPTSAVAYELSTTGVHSLDGDSRRVAGGLEITLRKFDQTAMVLLTSRHELKRELDRKVKLIAAESAETMVRLAQVKLNRVSQIDRELTLLGFPQADGKKLLAQAEFSARRAEEALGRDYHRARILAGESLQALRILQRAHWNDATDPSRNFSSPVSSPHTLCFQTLPNHWEMVARFGSRTTSHENLLRSGDFEDIDTMIGEGWQHRQKQSPRIIAGAELLPKPSPGGGEYCLHMAAIPASADDIPRHVSEPPVTLISPPINVHSGQLVHISGRVKVIATAGTPDGVMFYDSLGGPERGLRWQQRTDWQYFDLIREVTFTGPMSLTLRLTGLGDVYFDEVRVIAVTPAGNARLRSRLPQHDPRSIFARPENGLERSNNPDMEAVRQREKARNAARRQEAEEEERLFE